jgi:hypothetical protein
MIAGGQVKAARKLLGCSQMTLGEETSGPGAPSRLRRPQCAEPTLWLRGYGI